MAGFEKLDQALAIYDRDRLKYPNQFTFFRYGDFYELFREDAERFCAAFDRTLTRSPQGVPMTGIPAHAIYDYTARIRRLGVTVVHYDDPDDVWIMLPVRNNEES